MIQQFSVENLTLNQSPDDEETDIKDKNLFEVYRVLNRLIVIEYDCIYF